MSMEFFATCPAGFEDALADELRALGLNQVRKLKGRVSFAGEAVDGERACLWSRLASRVLVVLDRFECRDADDLYAGTKDMCWEQILAPGATIAVTAHGTNSNLRNTRFSSLRVKDAICDRMTEATGARPSVDTEHPGARIALSLRGERATLQLDLSGEPLFKRLPHEATEKGAPYPVMRPDYAALALAQCGWGKLCAVGESAGADAVAGAEPGTAAESGMAAGSDIAFAKVRADAEDATAAGPAAAIEPDTAAAAVEPGATAAGPLVLVDPHCSGGGIVLEAAQQLLDRAPGLLRARWGFEGWAAHDEAAWAALIDEADARAEAARGRAGTIVAADLDSAALPFAQRVLAAADVAERVAFMPANAQKIVAKLGLARAAAPARGAVVCDLSAVALTDLGRELRFIDGILCTERTEHLPLVAIARDATLAQVRGVKPSRSLAIKPGNEDALLLTFREAGMPVAAEGEDTAPRPTVEVADGVRVPVLVPESDQFAARLRKVAKQRRKWARRAGVTCYRVYDADLPDYAAAIDLYEGAPETPGRWLVIAEYAAPKTVDEDLARARMLDMLTIAPLVLDVAPDHVAARARTRSRGGSQYADGGKRTSVKRDMLNDSDLPNIQEGGLTFTVNFDDYLDCGIFLDHRITRDLVREHARGARWFLNLFAYTGTATCYAADAGVEETVTVDLSNTYLDWAERNMRQNGFTGSAHHYVRDDVLAWVREQRNTNNRWDLIFCDPPTFSNSSKMGRRTWDVQRDHVDLLVGISRLLTREGEAIFSCNLRTFKPDTEALARAGVVLTDITEQTIPEDFSRNKRIHHCYILKRYSIEEAMERAGMDAEAIAERQRELREGGNERRGGAGRNGGAGRSNGVGRNGNRGTHGDHAPKHGRSRR